MAHIKNVFPGGNTSLGFYSYYDYLPPCPLNRFFILKGGPGVGKSTFMKNISETFQQQDYDVEHHYCSSDNDSLDGVVIPSLGVALVDGTTPHIVEPKFPGAVDELIDLGAYWNPLGIETNKEFILRSTKEVSRLFKRAYVYLKAARLMVDDITSKHTASMNFNPVTKLTYDLIHELLSTASYHQKGQERHLFGSAFTPNGHVHYTESLLEGMEQVYLIAGSDGTGKSTLLTTIAKRAVDAGFYVEFYHAPLIPSKIETLCIPTLSIAYTTVHMEEYTYTKSYHLDDFLVRHQFGLYRYELEESHYHFVHLIENAIKNIRLAKLEHDALEKFYVPNMNFDQQQERLKTVINRIESYIPTPSQKIF